MWEEVGTCVSRVVNSMASWEGSRSGFEAGASSDPRPVGRGAYLTALLLRILFMTSPQRHDKNHPSAVALGAFGGARMEPHVFRDQLKRVSSFNQCTR